MTIRSKDNWIHKRRGLLCETCMWFIQKARKAGYDQIIEVGRCRRHAPTMTGYPVVYLSDWCGDHKLNADKLVSRGKAFGGHTSLPKAGS